MTTASLPSSRALPVYALAERQRGGWGGDRVSERERERGGRRGEPAGEGGGKWGWGSETVSEREKEGGRGPKERQRE